jgi:hypothetical protein
MRFVMVQFGPEVGQAQREAILAAVGAWPGVRAATCLKPQSTSKAVRRMGCVHVAREADLAEILPVLRGLPGIAWAEPERPRERVAI